MGNDVQREAISAAGELTAPVNPHEKIRNGEVLEVAWIVDFTVEEGRRKGSTEKRIVWWRANVLELQPCTEWSFSRASGTVLYDAGHGPPATSVHVSFCGRFLRHVNSSSCEDGGGEDADKHPWIFCWLVGERTDRNTTAHGRYIECSDSSQSYTSWRETERNGISKGRKFIRSKLVRNMAKGLWETNLRLEKLESFVLAQSQIFSALFQGKTQSELVAGEVFSFLRQKIALAFQRPLGSF